MSDCHCIRGEGSFLFGIKYYSKDFFKYQDFSNWNTDGKYSVPESYVVTITPPNSKVSYDIEVLTKVETKISKEKLGGTIKDGIYCLKFENCDYSYYGYFAITNKLDCCLEKMIINDQENWTYLKELLDKIKIAGKFNDIQLVKDLMITANDIADENGCNC